MEEEKPKKKVKHVVTKYNDKNSILRNVNGNLKLAKYLSWSYSLEKGCFQWLMLTSSDSSRIFCPSRKSAARLGSARGSAKKARLVRTSKPQLLDLSRQTDRTFSVLPFTWNWSAKKFLLKSEKSELIRAACWMVNPVDFRFVSRKSTFCKSARRHRKLCSFRDVSR